MNFINPAYGHLEDLAIAYKETFIYAEPFQHIVFRNFFNEKLLNEVLDEFDNLKSGPSIKFNTPNEARLISKGEQRFGPKTKQFVYFLNSEPFIQFLQEITNIEESLIPDPLLEGGGLHQVNTNGFLKIHTDFNKHSLTKLDKRINAIIYLNKDWKEMYGGHFEMWDSEMSHCTKKILPEYNTLLLFTTTDFTFHGLPNPLTCPEDTPRKSLSLYYYSNGRPSHEINDGIEEVTPIFKARKGDIRDTKMKTYNAGQSVKNIVKSFTPPILLKAASKVIKN